LAVNTQAARLSIHSRTAYLLKLSTTHAERPAGPDCSYDCNNGAKFHVVTSGIWQ